MIGVAVTAAGCDGVMEVHSTRRMPGVSRGADTRYVAPPASFEPGTRPW